MTNFDKILAAAQKRQGQPQPLKPQDSTVALNQITQRVEDTRSLNSAHVEALAESIAVLGLIEPLVLDNQNRLLAGGHRLAAITLLQQSHPQEFEQQFPGSRVPVRSMAFNADEAPDLALQIEIAENEQRRDYTPVEVRAIAERLKGAGYVELKGRPKKGQRALMPALSVVVGKSLRTVQHYLYQKEKDGTAALSDEDGKSAKHFALLQKAHRALETYTAAAPKTPEAQALVEAIPDILQKIAAALEKKDGLGSKAASARTTRAIGRKK